MTIGPISSSFTPPAYRLHSPARHPRYPPIFSHLHHLSLTFPPLSLLPSPCSKIPPLVRIINRLLLSTFLLIAHFHIAIPFLTRPFPNSIPCNTHQVFARRRCFGNGHWSVVSSRSVLHLPSTPLPSRDVGSNSFVQFLRRPPDFPSCFQGSNCSSTPHPRLSEASHCLNCCIARRLCFTPTQLPLLTDYAARLNLRKWCGSQLIWKISGASPGPSISILEPTFLALCCHSAHSVNGFCQFPA